MAKAFSVASWNVEHFKDDPQRIDRVVNFVKQQNPDVLALYEVEGKTVFQSLVSLLPNYQFHITEGPQAQEILVGAKNTMTAFFTQKVAFKSGNSLLRPGALLTLTVQGVHYSLLFLHTKSSSKPVGLGIRDDMFERAFDFKKTLDKAAANGKANFLFLGDLNTMGMEYPFQKNIGADVELQKLDREAKKKKMRRLTKDEPHTWWNGTADLPPSNLDHVVVAEQMKFKPFGNADIKVLGWPKQPTDAAKKDWIKTFSDHGLLFFQVEKV